jgi:O-antigen/teichoic acid export membrane protein
MSKTFNKVISGSFWGIIANVIDALAKFVTIPMLIGFYGKADYGLIALSFSLNAYLRLMELGMSTGAIRFFSMWFAKKEIDKVIKVSQSSIVFYGCIGIINGLIFLYLSHHTSYFALKPDQVEIFRWMMYALAASAVFNWTSYVVTQLLSAIGEIGWTNRTKVISSIFNFLTALMAIKFHLSLPFYFLLYILSTLVVIPLNIIRLNKSGVSIIQLIYPKWHFAAFREVLKYSIAIFAMGIFQFTANNLRPILLASFSDSGSSVLTDYRILQTICMLVISFGGVFLNVLLPISTKNYAEGNNENIKVLIYKGTKYISVFLSFIIFLLVLNADSILTLYVGHEYASLSVWLVIWLLTVLFYMHSSPVASLVLSTGRTKFLVGSSALSCIVSIIITIALARTYDVGAAVIGYAVYIAIQMGCYYFYYIPYILKLNSTKLFFGSFLPAAFVGAAASFIVHLINTYLSKDVNITVMVINSFLFSFLFAILIIAFIMKPAELKTLRKRFA